MKAPWYLEALGYKVDPTNPARLVHPDGHPYYPITLTSELNQGQCYTAVALAAYEAGYRHSTVTCALKQSS